MFLVVYVEHLLGCAVSLLVHAPLHVHFFSFFIFSELSEYTNSSYTDLYSSCLVLRKVEAGHYFSSCLCLSS
jgi:hypothetical protein